MVPVDEIQTTQVTQSSEESIVCVQDPSGYGSVVSSGQQGLCVCVFEPAKMADCWGVKGRGQGSGAPPF